MELSPLTQNSFSRIISQNYTPGISLLTKNVPFFDVAFFHLPCVDSLPSTEPLWGTLGVGENPNQQPKIFPFPSAEISPVIDLHLPLSKVSFLPYHIIIFM